MLQVTQMIDLLLRHFMIYQEALARKELSLFYLLSALQGFKCCYMSVYDVIQ